MVSNVIEIAEIINDHYFYSAPNREAIRYINDDDTTQSYTYAQVDEFSNQSKCGRPDYIVVRVTNCGQRDIVANWAINSGMKRGDVVAMIMDNKPEVIFTFIACMKIGVTLSMINSHLKSHPLLHSFSVCNATRFIIGKFGCNAPSKINCCCAGSEFIDAIDEMKQLPEANKLKVTQFIRRLIVFTVHFLRAIGTL